MLDLGVALMVRARAHPVRRPIAVRSERPFVSLETDTRTARNRYGRTPAGDRETVDAGDAPELEHGERRAHGDRSSTNRRRAPRRRM